MPQTKSKIDGGVNLEKLDDQKESYFAQAERPSFVDVGYLEGAVYADIVDEAGLAIVRYYIDSNDYDFVVLEPSRDDVFTIGWRERCEVLDYQDDALALAVGALASYQSIDIEDIQNLRVLMEDEHEYERKEHRDGGNMRRAFLQLWGSKYVVVSNDNGHSMGLDIKPGDLYGMQFREPKEKSLLHSIDYFADVNNPDQMGLNVSIFINVGNDGSVF